ncbi:transglutaminase, partial [Sinorhizobium meliloti]
MSNHNGETDMRTIITMAIAAAALATG